MMVLNTTSEMESVLSKLFNVVKNDFDMTDLARKYIKERNDKVSKPYTNYCCIFVNFVC